jgi:hypothetical protein
MLEKIKEILDSLSSALFQLQTNNEKAENKIKELDIQQKKLDEQIAAQSQKDENLNKREIAVKHIESIVNFSNEAKKKMAEANELMENAKKASEDAELKSKQLNKDKEAQEKELQDAVEANKKQAEALKAERKKFEKEKKDFEVRKRVEEES